MATRGDRVRVRWWDEEATTYRSAAMLSPTECAALPDLAYPRARANRADETSRCSSATTGSPARRRCKRPGRLCGLQRRNGGPLVAYRFDGEPDLSANVWCGSPDSASAQPGRRDEAPSAETLRGEFR